jgi:2-dehydro-3-deoxygluconokinase
MMQTNQKRIALFGECMIELQGEAFGNMRQTFGGDTLNTAVYLARLTAGQGVQISYATGLGDDRFSDGMLSRWEHEGVDTSLVRRLPGRVPGLYTISVDAHGERAFTYWRDQAAVRSYFDLPLPLLTPLEDAAPGLAALYFSGISLAILPLAARERLFAVAHIVRQAGGSVVFDNNYRPRLWPDVLIARQAFEQAVAMSDIAFITLEDDQLLYSDASADLALSRALASKCPELVIKRGALSTLLKVGDAPVEEIATVRVPRVVDSTAAGDSFAGAYLASRLSGQGPKEAAVAGNRLAALVIQHKGAIIPPELMAGANV